MHYVGHIDWSFADHPAPPAPPRPACARLQIVGPEQGAVHTDLRSGRSSRAAGSPRTSTLRGGALRPRGRAAARDRGPGPSPGPRRLRPVPDRHPPRAGQQRRGAGAVAVAQLAAAAGPGAGRTDTFFEPAQDLAAMDAAASRPPFGDPTLRLVGHYDGTAAAARDAARSTTTPRGRAPGRAWTSRCSSTAGSP